MERINERLSGLLTLKMSKFRGGNHHYRILSMDSDMLWTLAANVVHDFAEARMDCASVFL